MHFMALAAGSVKIVLPGIKKVNSAAENRVVQ